MKTCSKCNEEKDDSEFAKKGKGLQPYCRECNKIESRKYYKRNKTNHINNVKTRNKKQHKKYLEWKSTLSCEVCGESHTGCLDFHHLDPDEKDFTIATAIFHVGWERLMEEANKCIVLCKNCHVKVHDKVIEL